MDRIIENIESQARTCFEETHAFVARQKDWGNNFLKCLSSSMILLKDLPPFCNLLKRPLKEHVEHRPLSVYSTLHSTRFQVHLIHDMLEVTERNILRLGVDVVLRDDGRVKL